MPVPHKKFRVAICGGGVGGITCALALSRHQDIDLDVYEAAATFTEVGAGIGVWSRTWNLLKQLGLAEDLAKVTPRLPTDDDLLAFSCRKSDQPEGLNFHDMIAKGGLLTIHRADFHRVLISHLPDTCRIHCSKRLKSYSQQHNTGTIRLSFEDGSTASCDLLIGADGIKSRVRRSFLQEGARAASRRGDFREEEELLSAINPVWSGSLVYRTLIPAERLRAKAPSHRALTTPIQYLGKNAHIIAYPVSNGKLVNVAAFNSSHELENTTFHGPWVADAVDDEFRAPYSTWEPEVQKILECMENPMRWAIHVVKPLRYFASGRVALLGDAAHAMSPNQGSGAGQAIEDACVLATVLGHPSTTLHTIDRALEVYSQIRQPFATDIAERSLQNGKWLSLQYDGFDFDHCSETERRSKLRELAQMIYRRWEWAWTTDVDGSLQEAVRMLESRS